MSSEVLTTNIKYYSLLSLAKTAAVIGTACSWTACRFSDTEVWLLAYTTKYRR